MANAMVTLDCPRCGIKHTLKLYAYKKRLARDSNATICLDCRPPRFLTDPEDYWQFVKTTLRLNAR